MPDRPTPRSAFRLSALVLTLAAVGTLAGCAAPSAPAREIVWPFPPDKPRLKYVTSWAKPEQLETGFFQKLRRVILGKAVGLDVFNPSGIAFSRDESRLYVACSTTGRVVVLDFGKGEQRNLSFPAGHAPLAPWGLAVDGDDRLYVSDQKGSVVWVYDRAADFVLQIGKGLLVRPTGLAVDLKERIVYVADGGTFDNPRSVIEAFAFDGRHVRTIGSKGSLPGELHYPTFLAVDKQGLLYVSDSANSRISIFRPDGTLHSTFGARGDAFGQFGKPAGLAFDTAGNLHVADGQVGVMQIFDPDRRLLLIYGGQAPSPGYVLLPTGMAIDKKNQIYVADYAMSQIHQYSLFDLSMDEGPKAPSGAPASGVAPQPGGK